MNDRVDQVINDIWNNNMPVDYGNSFLLKEDSVKNAFYYHLRLILTDGFLKRHRLRIFTEYYLGKDKNGRQNYADLAIVKIRPKHLHGDLHLSELVEEVISIVELKFLHGKTESIFLGDVEKVKNYIQSKNFGNCRFYLGFIHEEIHDDKKIAWLKPREQKTWACGKVSELIANYSLEDERMMFQVITY